MSQRPNIVSTSGGIGLLAGGGEMGERIVAFDWSLTPLGPLAVWPQCSRLSCG